MIGASEDCFEFLMFLFGTRILGLTGVERHGVSAM